ncbi:MAG: cell wall-binding repeat-containing protein [Acidimicrobiaceae bacterium]|nr:cell wall-binding repeat-containing protein [Acidimicrobiaceae bacterium]
MANPRLILDKRPLAAVVAALLMASLLAVVAGSPSQAANTSGEELIDTDGDGVGDSREFAGSHRYNTAVALAERFAADEGSISAVIIASGETQVDAVTAAGLAGNLNAPVLLTRSNQLPHNVGRFIDEHNVTDVVVVGGTAAVPDTIVTAIEGLGSRPDVERVWGADRYATAAAVGSRLGGPSPTWCGSTQTAAILVNGGEAGRADAIVAGPLAFRLGLPVLLTSADELAEPTRAFLAEGKVERVVVVGGTGAVSAGVVDALIEDVGVVNVQRISGSSAAATSVAMAAEMAGNCADVLGTNPDVVALVNRSATADGIAAAPVLGRGLGAGGSVPILLVGGELPAAVSDYLAATAEVRDDAKTHLSIVAVGGTAVVSDAVMADAVAGAKTSLGLTASISVKVDPDTEKYEIWTADDDDDDIVDRSGGVFSVTFSDDVDVESVTDPTLYRINGRRVEALADTNDQGEETEGNQESISIVRLVYVQDRTVRIQLSHILEPGDTIGVAGGRQVAKEYNGDLRKLEAASLTLGALSPTVDRSAPTVEIVAVPGEPDFKVYVVEPNLVHNELVGSEYLSFVSITPKNTGGAAMDPETAPIAWEEDTFQERRIRADAAVTLSVNPPLVAGDVITVERRAVLDKGGRGSALVRYTVAEPPEEGEFEITSVSIGDYWHTEQASAIIGEETLRVTARPDGIAAGAAGNDWVIYGYDGRPGITAAARAQSTNAFDIDVGVDASNKVISYTIFEVTPARNIGRVANLFDLASALNAHDVFSANFELSFVVSPDHAKSDPLGETDAAGERFGDDTPDTDVTYTEEVGMTSVVVEVRFSDLVRTLLDDGAAIAGDIAPKFTGTPVIRIELPDYVLGIAYTSASLAELPTRLGFRVIAAGVATSYNADGDPDTPGDQPVTNIREILNALRPNTSLKP